MNIDLNSEDFDAKEGKAIFNGGLAGITEDVTISLMKKKATDKEGSPDYKIVYTDNTGATINSALYYVTKELTYGSKVTTIEDQVKKQGKVLKHLLHAVISPTFSFPAFSNQNEMLDGCMKALHGAVTANPGAKFRIFTNYGTTSAPKKFLQPRSWVPFLQIMSAPNDKLFAGDLDQMSRLAPDEQPQGNTNAGAPASEPVSDGW